MPVQLALALLIAPLLNGTIKAFKARWQNRRGPGIVQPWFDLVKYLSRESVVSEHASWVYRWVPYVYFEAHLVTAGLVPSFLAHAPLSGFGDVIVLIGLFALARFALALAALAVSYCQAVESLTGAAIPPRAAAIRTLFLELERLYNHLGDLGNLCAGTGFAVGASQGARLKEELQRLSGSRFLPVDVYIPGDPPRPQALIQGLLIAMDRLEPKLHG